MHDEKVPTGEEVQEQFTLSGRVIDLSKALPLKLRDWRALEKDGVKAKAIDDGVMETTFKMIHYVLRKADPSVTADEVDDLDLKDPIIKAIMEGISRERVDRPL